MQYRPGRVNGNADSLSRQYSGQVNEDRGDGFDLHDECPLDVTQNAGADVMLQQIGVFPSRSRADLMARCRFPVEVISLILEVGAATN